MWFSANWRHRPIFKVHDTVPIGLLQPSTKSSQFPLFFPSCTSHFPGCNSFWKNLVLYTHMGWFTFIVTPMGFQPGQLCSNLVRNRNVGKDSVSFIFFCSPKPLRSILDVSGFLGALHLPVKITPNKHEPIILIPSQGRKAPLVLPGSKAAGPVVDRVGGRQIARGGKHKWCFWWTRKCHPWNFQGYVFLGSNFVWIDLEGFVVVFFSAKGCSFELVRDLRARHPSRDRALWNISDEPLQNSKNEVVATSLWSQPYKAIVGFSLVFQIGEKT